MPVFTDLYDGEYGPYRIEILTGGKIMGSGGPGEFCERSLRTCVHLRFTCDHLRSYQCVYDLIIECVLLLMNAS